MTSRLPGPGRPSRRGGDHDGSGAPWHLIHPSAVIDVVRRPDLWPTALHLARSTRGAGPYLAFRRQTMFGAAADDRLDGRQLVEYLAWCRTMAALGNAQRAARRSR